MDTKSGHRVRNGGTHRARAILGGTVGAVVGAIASVNIIIFSGIEDGYQATPAQVFEESPIVGIIAILVLFGCVWGGAAIARRDAPT